MRNLSLRNGSLTVCAGLLLLSGCGGSPSLSAVRADMASEQLTVAEPMADSAGIVLVPIPAGEFWMGTAAVTDQPINEEEVRAEAEAAGKDPDEVVAWLKQARDKKAAAKKGAKRKGKKGDWSGGPESPRHRVQISRPFYIGAVEVTQSQFADVTGRRPWQGKPLVEEGDAYPASYISWEDATEFCRLLSERENATYRLPTEAEWEYACRAGTEGAFSFEDPRETFGDHVWFMDNTYRLGEQYPHAVGQKQANPWALRDMHGNLWEWCRDWYGSYETDDPTQPVIDPTGPEKGWGRTARGGSFAGSWEEARSAARGNPANREPSLSGFRVVREMKL